jgi:hypothetical protein
MNTNEVSNDKGFTTRKEYLQSLCERFKFSLEFVTELADAYDESEDFEGLIAALSIYSDSDSEIVMEKIEDAKTTISPNRNKIKPWLTTKYKNNFTGGRARSFNEICISCNHILGEHSSPSEFCPNIDIESDNENLKNLQNCKNTLRNFK